MVSLKYLIHSINKKRVSSLNIPIGETVLYVMALASKSGEQREFYYDAIYNGFDKLAKNFPDCFPGLYFRYLAGGVPYARKLENILSRMMVWGTARGWDFKTLELDERVVANIEEDIKKKYGEETLSKLKEIGDKFLELATADGRVIPIK